MNKPDKLKIFKVGGKFFIYFQFLNVRSILLILTILCLPIQIVSTVTIRVYTNTRYVHGIKIKILFEN